MKHRDMLSYRTSSLAAIALLTTSVCAQSLSYCSNQNTGSNYVAVNNIYNSYGSCGDQCRGNYAFAVMQYQNCWCSNYIPAAQQNIGSCNQNCPGYPDNKCGNQAQGLFGYLALSIAPSGTAGGFSSQASSSPASPSTQPSSTAQPSTAPQPTTEDPPTSYAPSPSSTSTPSTSTSTSTSTPPPAVVPVPVTTPETTSSTTASFTPVTSVRVVTVSGAVVTQYVTSTPIIASGSSGDSQLPIQRKSGISGGAIAGIVIGVIAGLAILALAAFLLWRRRKSSDAETSDAAQSGAATNSPRRNVSVLSKAGLLTRHQRPSTGEKDGAAAAADDWHAANGGSNSVRQSMFFSPGAEVSPVSPLGSSHDAESRRHSRPFVYDQRLNPSALFANQEANGSRISMQDTQDYSRPLGIANPDPRASFDSRMSRHG